eukprot:CAMPEP_0168346584 /NCGR_PEP_ID=MMETSP0213-20121227/18376_1 /TAXON_ID=151035 /ORGANISM="Euplotes harpa, Strain FSP1.4" /LENGTH=51 /DNA_ID=CAMNT_0008355299 /DNA_START=1 /DNA_END=156 /DNA_ORIENTATION=+
MRREHGSMVEDPLLGDRRQLLTAFWTVSLSTTTRSQAALSSGSSTAAGDSS